MKYIILAFVLIFLRSLVLVLLATKLAIPPTLTLLHTLHSSPLERRIHQLLFRITVAYPIDATTGRSSIGNVMRLKLKVAEPS